MRFANSPRRCCATLSDSHISRARTPVHTRRQPRAAQSTDRYPHGREHPARDRDLSESKRPRPQRIQRACHAWRSSRTPSWCWRANRGPGCPRRPFASRPHHGGSGGGKALPRTSPSRRSNSTHRLFLDRPRKVLSILLGNLLRNAFSYTDAGQVVVDIGDGKVSIRDTGVGLRRGESRRCSGPSCGAHASAQRPRCGLASCGAFGPLRWPSAS